MPKKSIWVWILLFGSIWGISEVVAGEILYSAGVPRASVWLTVWAIFWLSSARGMYNVPGSSALIGTVAGLFRLINAQPFTCHIFGIFFLGLVYDLAATIFLRRRSRSLPGIVSVGVLSAFIGNALFALTFTYVFPYAYWARAGWPKVFDHIFISGSLTALGAVLIVPLGLRLGTWSPKLAEKRGAVPAALMLTLLFWAYFRF